MRELTDAVRLQALMKGLGAAATAAGRVYFTGGASAVLIGWRASTLDADLLVVPDDDRLLRALPLLKEQLRMNLELACPSDFIPELPGWRERSPFIVREGRLDFFHYDFHAQALAKVERGHHRDQGDVREMLDRGLVDPGALRELFAAIESQLHRYPSIHPPAFRRGLEAALAGRG